MPTFVSIEPGRHNTNNSKNPKVESPFYISSLKNAGILGMWQLEQLFSVNELTQKKTYPFGEKVEGHILYNEQGTMTVLIESETGFVTAYTAKYILKGNDHIEHEIIQSTNKKWKGSTLYRSFKVIDKKLTISTFRENSDDKNTTTHLVWRKLD